MTVDWVAVATGALGIATVVGAVVTIRSTAAQNRRQQLADMATTAIDYFTRGTQNRSAGIAAMKMVQVSLASLKMNEREPYREAIRALLYGQLLHVYMYGENRFNALEVYNLDSMSSWLCSEELVSGLSRQQIDTLIATMEKYAKDAGPGENDAPVKNLLNKLPAWIRKLKEQCDKLLDAHQ